MRVLIIQNEADAPPGIFGDRLNRRGIGHLLIRPAEGEQIPDEIGRHTGLAVLGGPQSAADFETWPYLAHEAALMRRFSSAGLPVIGFCLGGQLLARALGGRVRRNHDGEIGYVAISPAEPAGGAPIADDPLFSGWSPCCLPAWHQDSFDIPAHADWLLRSARCPGQAFRVGRSYGLQFHAEADRAIFGAWHRRFAHRHEPEEPGITARLTGEMSAFGPGAEERGAAIFDQWIDLLDA